MPGILNGLPGILPFYKGFRHLILFLLLNHCVLDQAPEFIGDEDDKMEEDRFWGTKD